MQNREVQLENRAVAPEVIARTYVGYFPLMASQPFGEAEATGITNGTRITSTAVGLSNAAKISHFLLLEILNKTLTLPPSYLTV